MKPPLLPILGPVLLVCIGLAWNLLVHDTPPRVQPTVIECPQTDEDGPTINIGGVCDVH